jgi:hypothetical protein
MDEGEEESKNLEDSRQRGRGRELNYAIRGAQWKYCLENEENCIVLQNFRSTV